MLNYPHNYFPCITSETLMLPFMGSVSHSPNVHLRKDAGPDFLVIPRVPWSLLSWTSWRSSVPPAAPHRASAPASDHPGGYLLNLLQLSNIFRLLKGPKLDAVVQKQSNEYQDEAIKHFPWSSVYNTIFPAKCTVSSHYNQAGLMSGLLSIRTRRGFPAELLPKQSVSPHAGV